MRALPDNNNRGLVFLERPYIVCRDSDVWPGDAQPFDQADPRGTVRQFAVLPARSDSPLRVLRTSQMVLIYAFLVASLSALIYGSHRAWRALSGRPLDETRGIRVPWWVYVELAIIGLIGVASTVSGLLFNNPHWLIDHVYSAIYWVLR
jgi:hypothetical protein